MCYTVASQCRMKIARSLFSCNSGKLIKTFVQKFSILYVRFFKHFYWNTHKIKMKCFQVHCLIPEHIVPRLLLQQCLIQSSSFNLAEQDMLIIIWANAIYRMEDRSTNYVEFPVSLWQIYVCTWKWFCMKLKQDGKTLL